MAIPIVLTSKTAILIRVTGIQIETHTDRRNFLRIAPFLPVAGTSNRNDNRSKLVMLALPQMTFFAWHAFRVIARWTFIIHIITILHFNKMSRTISLFQHPLIAGGKLDLKSPVRLHEADDRSN